MTQSADTPGPQTPATGTLPARARVVVVGGGVIGASVAYHLTLTVDCAGRTVTARAFLRPMYNPSRSRALA